jgi:uncharacterized protein (TIGR00375 family)
MKLIADLHIHSYYSRATSKELTFEHLYKWAQLKGVNIVATGDIAHPGWFKEINEKLAPAEEGLFKLKDEFAARMNEEIPEACKGTVRFILGGEISNIYKKNERVRKNHNLVFMPSFEAVQKFQDELEKIGNIRSDGRPILGLDARDLLEIVLSIDTNAHLSPAHIWTPWFSMLGSKSGFDTVEECFEDLSEHIFAVETGLSSDPPMNWRLSQLDKYTLVSNSDAHSPQKLAREANVFNIDLSYNGLFEALISGDKMKLGGTIEFFPEEGKYHYDGHRKCGIRWDPKTTLENNNICTVCGKPITVGVLNRVETLADRQEGEKPEHALEFKSLIPLPEILGEVFNVGANSKKVTDSYFALLNKLGSELSILRDIPIDDIKNTGGELLAEAISRMRSGNVTLAGGYDGEFGTIKLFDDNERDKFGGQQVFFTADKTNVPVKYKAQKYHDGKKSITVVKENQNFTLEFHKEVLPDNDLRTEETRPSILAQPAAEDHSILSSLNERQKEAVLYTDTHIIITAGPGTGKTKTLTHRIAYLVKVKGINPENILAVTFTNKAADEMRNRLNKLLSKYDSDKLTIKTFHALAAGILRENAQEAGIQPNFSICGTDDSFEILRTCLPANSKDELFTLTEKISRAKNSLLAPDSPGLLNNDDFDSAFIESYKLYQNELTKNNFLDFDDLILRTTKLLETNRAVGKKYRNRFRWISIDEYQDINHAQYVLLKLLTQGGNNICVIGDPDQAIYGFRGSSREYFLKFDADFPSSKKIRLIKNYRSTQIIINASSQVIIKDHRQEMVKLLAQTAGTTKLEIYRATTYKAEAEYVVHQIEKMVGGTSCFSIDSGRVADNDKYERSFADFVVLYRIGAQSYALIEAFKRSGIPFQTSSDKALYDHKIIKEMLTYLWFVYNPDSYYYREKIRHKYGKLIPQLEKLRPHTDELSVSELIERIKESLSSYIHYGFDTEQGELIHRLIRRANPYYNRLKDFLDSTVLGMETDEYDSKADRVALMTIHASKGLEFPVVFITGCEENLIPYKRENAPMNLQEERRLFYVGMTRAKEKLILTHADKRFLFGKTYNYSPSRFLGDIEAALKEIKKSDPLKTKKDTDENSAQLGLF